MRMHGFRQQKKRGMIKECDEEMPQRDGDDEEDNNYLKALLGYIHIEGSCHTTPNRISRLRSSPPPSHRPMDPSPPLVVDNGTGVSAANKFPISSPHKPNLVCKSRLRWLQLP